MASLLHKIERFARGPQGRRLAEKAQRYARDPATRRRIDKIMQRVTGKRHH